MGESQSSKQARYYVLSGHVQGVGFRPFVYQLAQQYQINGWIENQMGQVAIHAEGSTENIRSFRHALIENAPPYSNPELRIDKRVKCDDFNSFSIRSSNPDTATDVRVISDLPVCDLCLQEMRDPNNRRYRYPFINCMHCGPRYTLIREMPYDRANTTMHSFALCKDCQLEYQDPLNRRHHAEPIACAKCGPVLQFQKSSQTISESEAALAATIHSLKQGEIVAVKGIGGYHLMVDACNDRAVTQLRRRKPRPHKPLAVMIDQAQLDQHVLTTTEQITFLNDKVHPILLLPRQPGSRLSTLIAPGLQDVGVMLPYSPLHHLLLTEFGGPLVATSANISGEPLLTDNHQVQFRLSNIADAFLHHNRHIQRPADDPVYRVIQGEPRVIRLGRGNAPLELELPIQLQHPVLAVGGHMKNTVALAWNNRMVISPHIGELDTMRGEQVFMQVIRDLQQLYHVKAQYVVCDAHPHYTSHTWAKNCGLPYLSVLHHHAHASVLPGEFPESSRWLVFSWDGTGYGADATVWGGEALLGTSGTWQRVASMRPFYLPGGDRAGREPWRSAAALCWEAGIDWQPNHAEARLAKQAWSKKINCPQSSAVGRLFDAAACLIGMLDQTSFEGQAPMLLEANAQLSNTKQAAADALTLELEQDKQGIWRSDWSRLLIMLLDPQLSLEVKASCFHESLALNLLHQALQVRDQHGEFAVGLSGGVFQNRVLTERAMELLRQHGFAGYLPQQVPVNDGGLCFGQIFEAHAVINRGLRDMHTSHNQTTVETVL